MKSNFALSFSTEGMRLVQRQPGGWHLVGQVALDDDDLNASLADLRAVALSLEPGGIATKILIPNDQIKYLALDTTRAEDADVWLALDGATPYSVDELTYDFVKGGGRTYIAAVARETLIEAREFAEEHGFNPISFAAIPEPFTFKGEVFFGAVNGEDVSRDNEPVIVNGTARKTYPEALAEGETVDALVSDTPPQQPIERELGPADVAQDDDAKTLSGTSVYASRTTPAREALLASDSSASDTAATADGAFENLDDLIDHGASATDARAQTPSHAKTNLKVGSARASGSDGIDPSTPSDTRNPVFASRARPERTATSPAAPTPNPKSAEAAKQPAAKTRDTHSPRTEPSIGNMSFGNISSPPVITAETGRDDTSASVTPRRDADHTPATPPITTDPPDPDRFNTDPPVVTGDAPDTLPPEAVRAAASLSAHPAELTDTQPSATPDNADEPTKPSQNRAEETKIGGSASGIFASRRAPELQGVPATDGATSSDIAQPEPVHRTVFGARKKAAPKAVVGGKPRFLGLILTAILLLFLLAIAAFAALTETDLARWFGFGAPDPQIAAVPSDPPANSTPPAADLPFVTDTPLASDPPQAPALAPPEGAEILAPEDAARVYAATGVWQRAPRIPLTPRTTSLEAYKLDVTRDPFSRVAAPGPLVQNRSVTPDSVFPTPVDPPPEGTVFTFDAAGRIAATEQGAPTADGVLIFAGEPPLNPPTRPGTIAPEITPLEQLATLIPEQATPLPDMPDDLIVIAGRPEITPPLRAGPPATPQEGTASLTEIPLGVAPENALLATSDLIVLSGAPPVRPPIRPGTTAPPAQPTVQSPAPPSVQSAPDTAPPDPSDQSARTPDANTPRPLVRPAELIEAAVQIAPEPTAQIAAFRPRVRPATLAPERDETVEAVIEQVARATPPPAQSLSPSLQISPAIAAAVQAAANRPNPIVNPTRLAITSSLRPDLRPRNMARIVDRANAARQQQQQLAAAQSSAPRAVAPSGPTANSVARNATLSNVINLRDINLIGIYGSSNDRRALIRLGNGRYQRVTVGDRLDGGRVSAISAGALRYVKRGREITLQVAG